jgi:DNA polymerase-3 subunit gamma/tau
MTFRDVFSQEHITTALENQIKNNQTVHAYLFTGSRGTGKTTCARIFAKALNCLEPEDGNPCLKCDACLMIENNSQDISEIDAASNNGVDDVRLLREEVRYAPVSLKYRVYIIDEVHMLSAGAWGALLKTLEEPPAHVVFILATTENHKVPATILSRCQRFEFKRVNLSDSAKALKNAAKTENVNLTDDAAQLIARLSDGGMRDALSLLEMCISIDTEITGKTVREAAGVAGSEYIFGISEAVLAGNAGTALKIINTLHEQSKDMGRLLLELIGHYRNLMLLKLMPDESDLITWLPEEVGDYRELCGKYELKKIMECLNSLEEYTERISRSRDKRLTAELAIVEMCTTNVGAAISRPPGEPYIPAPLKSTPPPEKPSGIPWNDVLRELPSYLSGMLENTKVNLNNNILELTDNALVGSIIENPDNKAKITTAFYNITRQKVEVNFINDSEPTINCQPSTVNCPPPPINKLNDIKNLLKQKGIEVKER